MNAIQLPEAQHRYLREKGKLLWVVPVENQPPEEMTDVTHTNDKSKWWWWNDTCPGLEGVSFSSSLGKPGDRLFVQEEFDWVAALHIETRNGLVDKKRNEILRYKVDGLNSISGHWSSASTMPEWASRTKPTIVSVEVKRLGGLAAGDLEQTGTLVPDKMPLHVSTSPEADYYDVANHVASSIYRDGSYATDAWVWVYQLEVK